MKYIYSLLVAFLFLSNLNLKAQSDACASAPPIAQTCTWYSGSNVGFGTGSDDSYVPGDICAVSLENTAWYSFTPTVSANYDVFILI